jgi:salicylate hydroxylase
MQLISPQLWDNYQSVATFNGWESKQDIWFDFTVGEGPHAGQRITEVKLKDGVSQSTAHRAQFLAVLTKMLPKDCAQFNKRYESIDQRGDKVTIKFVDGSNAHADAVIGCDGIRSASRSSVYSDQALINPVFTQKVAYRGIIPMPVAEASIGAELANNRMMYLGHGGHLLTFPVAKGTLMNVVAFHTSQKEEWEGEWVQSLQKANAERDFVGWGEEVTKIMALIQALDVWAIFDHPRVETFHEERLCLLGDAAHATSPHFGQGAGMAIEDAYILSDLLGKCSSSSEIIPAFDVYDAVRLERTQRVVEESREQGKRLDMEGKGTGDDLKKLAEKLDTAVRWIWDEDLEAELAKAIEAFESSRRK